MSFLRVPFLALSLFTIHGALGAQTAPPAVKAGSCSPKSTRQPPS